MVTGRKGRGEERKVQDHRRHVTFVTGKVIGRMTVSIDKINLRERGKLRRQT